MERTPFYLYWSHMPQRRFLDRQDRKPYHYALIFSHLPLAFVFEFFVWLLHLYFRKREFHSFVFLGAEIISFPFQVLMAFDVWHMPFHRPEGLVPARQWMVDVLFPCCRDPFEVIQTNLLAFNSMAYKSMESGYS